MQLATATVVPLSSTSDWITPENLKSMWIASDAARSSGDAFKIDGQIYTNNSIFTLTRSKENNGGKMIVNGSLVASDVGVLAPNQIDIHYDQRLKTFLNIKDDSKVKLYQVAWYTE